MSREQIVLDPSAWTGMSPPQWPSPADYPFPAPLTVHESSLKTGLGGALSLTIGLLAANSAFVSGKSGLMGFVVAPLVAAVGLALGLALLWKAFRIKDSGKVSVAMDARGLVIPFFFEDIVPWSYVKDVVYNSPWAGLGYSHRPPIVITIRDEARFKPTPWRQTAAAHSIDVLLPNSFDVSSKKIFETIQSYRAHFGRGGKQA